MSKKIDSGPIGFVKRVYLKYLVGYQNPQTYWNKRYSLNLKTDCNQERNEPQEITRFTNEVLDKMKTFGCNNILEVGCGRGKHRSLPGWVGLDFSTEVLKQSGLKEYVYADFTSKIPLPTKSFDCVMCQFVLLHVPNDKIVSAVSEMCRVASKLVLVCEPETASFNAKNYSFKHELKGLFKECFGGKILFSSGDGSYEVWR